jgi:transposase
MSDLYWLSEARVERLSPCFAKSLGKPRVDDRRLLTGIIYIQRYGLMGKHAPRDYRPPKTLYNSRKRCSRMGVFATIMTELAAQAQDTEMVMLDATHLKTHRTASSHAIQKGAQ